MNNKEKYLDFYNTHSDICIYSSPWWLDTVCGPENWNVILIENKNREIIASFPFFLRHYKFGLKTITMPPLTQKLGPYIIYDNNKISEMKKIGYEHEIYNKILEYFPNVSSVFINFDQKYKNWLPFYWAGYNQTSRYSYQIHNIKDYESVKKNYAKSKKYEIPKAQKILTLKYDLSPDIFYDYFSEVVRNRGDKPSYSRELFKSIYDAVYEHNAGRCFYCVDKYGNIHALNLTIWDKNTAYYLIAMRKKEFNTSGGTEFLVDETIKYVSQFVNTFDFEGSMIKGVEASYRNYGGIQTEYYNISKTNSPIVMFAKFGIELLNLIKK